MNERIIKFINKHHIFTLSTSKDNEPYCCTCFYAYDKSLNLFIFTSDNGTKHVNDMIANKKVAAAIALETKIIGKIQGLQITGTILELNEDLEKKCRSTYLKKFPFAILKDTIIWALEPDFLKLTDNTLGFGKKIIWTSQQ